MDIERLGYKKLESLKKGLEIALENATNAHIPLDATEPLVWAQIETGLPVPLGIPAPYLEELVHRTEDPLAPNDLFGLGEHGDVDRCFVAEYRNAAGYAANGWHLIEKFTTDEDLDGPLGGTCEPQLRLELHANRIFKMWPRPDLLDFPMAAMCKVHPVVARSKFVCEPDGYGTMSVLAFSAFGHAEIGGLRRWLARKFFPLVWPDIQATVLELLYRFRSDEPALLAELEAWVQGKRSTRHLRMMGK